LFISTAHTEMEKEKQEEIEKLHKEIDKRGTWFRYINYVNPPLLYEDSYMCLSVDMSNISTKYHKLSFKDI
jgi:hypothetical protein